MPLRAATEVFGSSVRHLLRMAGGAAADDSDRPDPEALRAAELDLEMLCDTLVKLLEFDDGVGRVMLECVWPAGAEGRRCARPDRRLNIEELQSTKIIVVRKRSLLSHQ